MFIALQDIGSIVELLYLIKSVYVNVFWEILGAFER